MISNPPPSPPSSRLYEASGEKGEHSPSRSVRFHEATALTRADVEASRKRSDDGSSAGSAIRGSSRSTRPGRCSAGITPGASPWTPRSASPPTTGRAWSGCSGTAPDGRTLIRLAPLELLDRLAALVAQVHHARPLVYPECGESMRLIAFLTDPFSIQDVLNHLGEPVRPPPLRPARGPPELEFGFAEPSADEMDQTPAVNPAEPEPITPYKMDQTRSW